MRENLFKTGAALLVLTSAAAALAAETGFSGGPYYSTVVNGDYAVTGSSTRSSSTGQPDPFSMDVTNVPAGASVVKAFASWSHLTNDPLDPANAAIEINATPVTGALVGYGDPDLCWGLSYGASYVADVTSIVTGNGTYRIGGATDDFSTGALGEGITLLLIYDDGSAAKVVDVFAGYTGNTSNPSGPAVGAWTFSSAYAGGSAHFFVNGLDGQFADDDFLINSMDASALSGGTPTDAWQGLIGPGGAGSNYYDHAEGDIASYLSAGDTGLELISGTPDFDCVGHSFGALSYVPEPASLVILALGALALRRR
ncbi:MAG: hypothetical protein HRF50_07505 [Phycisphaerae bacterium]|jgi:hypothetical protein